MQRDAFRVVESRAVAGQRFATRRDAKDETMEWLIRCNKTRLHSKAGLQVLPVRPIREGADAIAKRFPIALLKRSIRRVRGPHTIATDPMKMLIRQRQEHACQIARVLEASVPVDPPWTTNSGHIHSNFGTFGTIRESIGLSKALPSWPLSGHRAGCPLERSYSKSSTAPPAVQPEGSCETADSGSC